AGDRPLDLTEATLLIVLLALFLVALVAPLIINKSGRQGFLILAAVPTAGFIWVATQLPKILASEELLASGAAADNRDSALVQTWEWIPQLGVQLSFRLDTLSAFLSLRSEEHTSELQSRFDLVC